MLTYASLYYSCYFLCRSGKNFSSINDLLTFVGDPLPIKEKTGLSLSIVKSLVLREKEECDEEFHSLMCSLFGSGRFMTVMIYILECNFTMPKSFAVSLYDPSLHCNICKTFAVEHFPLRNNGSCLEILHTTSLLKDLHGAPPESFVVQLSQIIGGFKSLQKMASFWQYVIIEVSRCLVSSHCWKKCCKIDSIFHIFFPFRMNSLVRNFCIPCLTIAVFFIPAAEEVLVRRATSTSNAIRCRS